MISAGYWLPISSQIQYKIALICIHIASGTAPPYLSELLHLNSPSRSLHSAADTGIFCGPGGEIFSVHWICTLQLSPSDLFSTLDLHSATLSIRSFQYTGSALCNSLHQIFSVHWICTLQLSPSDLFSTLDLHSATLSIRHSSSLS